MKFFYLINIAILTLQSTLLFAQYPSKSEILKDDNIPWAGEFELDIIPDFSKDEKQLALYDMKGKNLIQTIKLNNYKTNTLFYQNDEKLQLNYRLFEHWENLSFYKDSNLKQRLTPEENLQLITGYDTVIAFDPETFAETKKLVRFFINFDDVIIFRLKAIIYYDMSSMDFKIIPKAVGVILNLFDDSNDFKNKEVLAWMPVNEWFNNFDIDKKSIPWVKRVHRDLSFSEIETFKTTKNTSSTLQQFFDDLQTKRPPIYNGYFQLLKDNDIASIGKSVDTIITFDPETFEETVTVKVHKLYVENIKVIRFSMDWAWDNETHKLYIEPIGFSIFCDVFNENTNQFRYRFFMFSKYLEKHE